MAVLYPSLENINRLKVPPTEGELHLLNFLKSNLDDTYEVYFQPYLNGDRPDIVLMRKNSGVMIIEVKDWNLKNSIYTKSRFIKSPLDQVNSYKENLFNLHIKNLYELKQNNHKLNSIVSCTVYFHKAKEEDRIYYKKKKTQYIELIYTDTLTNENLKEILKTKNFDIGVDYFTEELYDSFKRYLQPPLHTLEEGKNIQFTEKQEKLTISRPVNQKIKGVAGSGKTLVLARRAVNAHKRTKSQVLILTFNITLKNYIHDKISEVREEYNWKYFTILNYHQFLKSEANNHNLRNLDFEDEMFFENVKDKITKYEAIFVDEVQDYKIEWLRILKKYFLVDSGEFVLFGDEKQNIYGRDLELDKKSKTNIKGRWNELNESFRLTTKIANIAIRYQNYFFSNKYELDEIKIIEQKTILDYGTKKPYFKYCFYTPTSNYLTKIQEKIYEIMRKLEVHPNDVCILSSNIKTIRELDFLIRNNTNEKTEIMCPNKETYEEFSKKGWDNKLKIIDRNKKFNFWMNSGTIKLSTIHSFKGWEIHTLFLIIEEYDESCNETYCLSEQIYTGITRCTHNLIVINIGNTKHNDFFEKIND